MRKVRVLVVDDSPLARQVLVGALARDPELEIVGTAVDALSARRRLEQQEVDVLTLDLEMPKMDGLSFLRALLATRPIPVIMVSALTPRGSAAALRALELGAVEVVAKPTRSLEEIGEDFTQELVEKVKAAACAKVRLRRAAVHVPRPVEPLAMASPAPSVGGGGPVILIGASTGGCDAIPTILSALPPDGPPVVCIQHIPPVFSATFARRLDELGNLRVTEAQTGDVLERGRAFVAPGGRHLVLRGRGERLVLEVQDSPPVNHHRPSIDVTFRSAAQQLGPRAVAAILTGMGKDGVEGMAEIRACGGYTLAQDEATSVVFGMPREAISRQAARAVAPLEQIARLLLGACLRMT